MVAVLFSWNRDSSSRLDTDSLRPQTPRFMTQQENAHSKAAEPCMAQFEVSLPADCEYRRALIVPYKEGSDNDSTAHLRTAYLSFRHLAHTPQAIMSHHGRILRPELQQSMEGAMGLAQVMTQIEGAGAFEEEDVSH